MRTAQLPITVKVQALTGSTASGWTSVCSNVTVEGGTDPALWGYTYSKPNAPYALSTTETPIVSIRPALSIYRVSLFIFVQNQERVKKDSEKKYNAKRF